MPNVNDIYDFCLQKIKSNPKAANTPLGQEYIRILESRDAAAGNQMANNLCQELGTDQKSFIQNLFRRN